jgi:peptide/nickel transport system permease protein
MNSERKIKSEVGRRIPIFAISIVALYFFAVIFGPLLTPHDPFKTNLNKSLLPPAWQLEDSTGHLLGTDSMGRDILSRLIYGARTSMIVSVLALCICAPIGVLFGLLSGYFGGKLDMLIMRFTDLWMSMPAIITAILMVSVLGPSKQTVIIVVGITGWIHYARIVRGEVLSYKEREFVQLARVTGCSNARIIFSHIFPNVVNSLIILRIIFSHIFPNVVNSLIILVTLDFGRVIIITATLSFLGLGIQPPSAAWGLMLAEGRQYITYAWWMSAFPGIAILFAVLGMNMTGDWLRDVLDPKQKLR